MKHIGSLALLRTVYAAMRFRRVALLIYKGASVRLDPSALSGRGRLSVGKRWIGQPTLPSSFVVFKGGTVEVTGNFVFHRGSDVRVGTSGVLRLGDGYAADGVHIDCHAEVTIGRGTAIAKGVTIMDTDHHEIVGKHMVAPVTIGSHCWIGAGATILKGVTIGDGAVIGARAVVTRDVPAGTAAAGNPAKVLGPIEWKL